jgi:hypothetical protein
MFISPPVSDTLQLNPQLKYLLHRSRLLRDLLVPVLVARHHAAYYGSPLPREHPRALSEIINWAKAWGDLERFAPFADKYQSRRYIKAVVGENHLVPLLAVADKASDLDWDSLPAAFVLKATHGSGWNIIVRDKTVADRPAILSRLDNWMSQSFFFSSLEPQYAPIKPRIIAESCLGDPRSSPADYKINCSLGTPLLIQADYGRHDRHTRAILDLDWHPLPCMDGETIIEPDPPQPAGLATMLDLARRLSKPFPFVRVDFYDIDGAVYVGELTFTPASGLFRTTPADYDLVMGRGIDFNAYRRPLSMTPLSIV